MDDLQGELRNLQISERDCNWAIKEYTELKDIVLNRNKHPVKVPQKTKSDILSFQESVTSIYSTSSKTTKTKSNIKKTNSEKNKLPSVKTSKSFGEVIKLFSSNCHSNTSQVMNRMQQHHLYVNKINKFAEETSTERKRFLNALKKMNSDIRKQYQTDNVYITKFEDLIKTT